MTYGLVLRTDAVVFLNFCVFVSFFPLSHRALPSCWPISEGPEKDLFG